MGRALFLQPISVLPLSALPLARLPPCCALTMVATELLENGCFPAPAFVEVFAFLCRDDLQAINSLGTKHQPIQIREGITSSGERNSLSPQPPFCWPTVWMQLLRADWRVVLFVFPIAGIHLGRLYHSRRLRVYLTSIHNANEGT